MDPVRAGGRRRREYQGAEGGVWGARKADEIIAHDFVLQHHVILFEPPPLFSAGETVPDCFPWVAVI